MSKMMKGVCAEQNSKINNLEEENKQLKQRVEELDTVARLDSLIIHGLTEDEKNAT